MSINYLGKNIYNSEEKGTKDPSNYVIPRGETLFGDFSNIGIHSERVES